MWPLSGKQHSRTTSPIRQLSPWHMLPECELSSKMRILSLMAIRCQNTGSHAGSTWPRTRHSILFPRSFFGGVFRERCLLSWIEPLWLIMATRSASEATRCGRFPRSRFGLPCPSLLRPKSWPGKWTLVDVRFAFGAGESPAMEKIRRPQASLTPLRVRALARRRKLETRHLMETRSSGQERPDR